MLSLLLEAQRAPLPTAARVTRHFGIRHSALTHQSEIRNGSPPPLTSPQVRTMLGRSTSGNVCGKIQKNLRRLFLTTDLPWPPAPRLSRPRSETPRGRVSYGGLAEWRSVNALILLIHFSSASDRRPTAAIAGGGSAIAGKRLKLLNNGRFLSHAQNCTGDARFPKLGRSEQNH